MQTLRIEIQRVRGQFTDYSPYSSFLMAFCKRSKGDTLEAADCRPAVVPRQKRIRDLYPDPWRLYPCLSTTSKIKIRLNVVLKAIFGAVKMAILIEDCCFETYGRIGDVENTIGVL